MVAPVNKDEMPFVANCRQLSATAPFRWLWAGFRDFRSAPKQSLVYGVSVAIITAIVVALAWNRGSQWILYAMLGGFVFMAPLCCVGLYAISAQLERCQTPSITRSFRAAFRRHLGNEMVFALVLLVIFLIWARAAIMVTVFFPTDGDASVGELATFLGIGTTVGALFAGVTFSASAFSLPMLVHRDVDSVTAIVSSINAVLRNIPAMLVWLTLVVGGLLLGVATACVGLVIIVPLIGYGAWHGYLETIEADDFPRHTVGITSTPRETTSVG